MTSPSSIAGKPCVECGIPDPCVFDATSDFPEAGEKHFWLKEEMARFELLDDGFGCDGIVTTTYQYDNSGTHEAWLEEESENSHKILQPFGKPNNATLYYEGFKGGMNIINTLHSSWEYLSSIIIPHDVLHEPAHYTTRIDSCYEHSSYVEIKVYLLLEIRFTTGLGYRISSSQQTRAVKDQRDEWGKTREAMEDIKPEDKDKPRNGWTNTAAEFGSFHKTSLTVELELKVTSVEYTYRYIEETKKLRQVEQLEQMNRIDALIKSINKYFVPDPDNRDGTRKCTLFGTKIEPVTLGISYAYQYTDIKNGPCYFHGLYGVSFFKASFRFDIISFACAYCKMEGLINRHREYLRKHGTSAEYYIEISSEVNLNLEVIYSQKDKAWEFGIKESNIKLGLKGEVSAVFETNVLVVKLKSRVGASIEARAGFGFDKRDDGMNLTLFHSGVTGAFRVKVNISCGNRNRRGNNEEPEKENEFK